MEDANYVDIVGAIKSNISEQKRLALQLIHLSSSFDYEQSPSKKSQISVAADSIQSRMRIINNSIFELINSLSIIKKLPSSANNNSNTPSFVQIYHSDSSRVFLSNSEKTNYLKELKISEDYLKRLKLNDSSYHDESLLEYKKPNIYVSIANRFFSDTAYNLTNKGYFYSLGSSLKKANFSILLSSYVSVLLFSTFLSFLVGVILFVFFTFFYISPDLPFILIQPHPLKAMIFSVWLIFIIPILTFLSVYFYPIAEQSSIQSNIDNELPFVTLQMSAIASSDISPSDIFKIIALSKEYPYIRKEAKKLMNQVNLYGYDIVTALKNVASSSPSKNWADLLNGMSNIIRSGGDLSKYLHKRSETFLFEYRINREKATRSAETFMDIYISVVIAAPMLMLLLLIMINISNLGISIPMYLISLIVVVIVALINIIFLIFLHIKKSKF
ncbi:MAG: type II secretion system F family protein [Candidatus Pacearchaeota archaeon]